jgi:CBS domain containing-hemolysin-like protein
VELYGSEAIGYMTAILTFGTIIFSEVIPKSLGAHHAPRISRRVAPFLRVFIFILYPLVIVLERFVRLFKSGKRKVGTEEQIRALANIGGGAGHIDAEERELIHRAFVLNDKKIQDILTPRDKIVAIKRTSNVRQAAEAIFSNHYSRYPVIGDSLDDVRGYVLSRDVLEALADGSGEAPITSLVRKILTVSVPMSCDDLLGMLRRNGMQIAIVTDKGKTVGIVTLEDVLEELVGEFKAEGDVGA